jgi:hypothetical protein
MMYVVTPRSERLVRELLSFAKEVDAPVLARASALAQGEWSELLARLPSEADLRRGVIALGEDELGWLLSKAMRFHDILRTVAPATASTATRPLITRTADLGVR